MKIDKFHCNLSLDGSLPCPIIMSRCGVDKNIYLKWWEIHLAMHCGHAVGSPIP